MKNTFIVLGSLLAALAVMLGAFAAHGLREYLSQIGRTDTFETAVRYHFYHAFGLLLLGILQNQFPAKNLSLPGYLLLAGVVIFSGSLYILSTANLRWMGAVAPIGGTLLIAGWLVLGWQFLKN
jgi:uncharacterized membrane protein YgdD (TMEM256/DUF423 family)